MLEKILIVDDEKVLADSISDYFTELGITSRVEISPASAIEGFNENPADVVIVDFKFASLSEKTGLDIIDEIRTRRPSTRFILISGLVPFKVDDPEVKQQLMAQMRVDHFFKKPFSVAELGKAVSNLLNDIEAKATDWAAVAKDYVASGSVSSDDVRKLNNAYKAAILKSLEEESE